MWLKLGWGLKLQNRKDYTESVDFVPVVAPSIVLSIAEKVHS